MSYLIVLTEAEDIEQKKKSVKEIVSQAVHKSRKWLAEKIRLLNKWSVRMKEKYGNGRMDIRTGKYERNNTINSLIDMILTAIDKLTYFLYQKIYPGKAPSHKDVENLRDTITKQRNSKNGTGGYIDRLGFDMSYNLHKMFKNPKASEEDFKNFRHNEFMNSHYNKHTTLNTANVRDKGDKSTKSEAMRAMKYYRYYPKEKENLRKGIVNKRNFDDFH